MHLRWSSRAFRKFTTARRAFSASAHRAQDFLESESKVASVCAALRNASNYIVCDPPYQRVVRCRSLTDYRLTLDNLVYFGKPPLSDEQLIASAQFTQAEIPIRLAKRIEALRGLPFIVVRNPHIHRIYSLYLKSFHSLISQPVVETLQQDKDLLDFLLQVVQDHSNTIPTLALGLKECREYISPREITNFLDRHLRARIGTRLIAEQHVALHQVENPALVGIVDTNLSPQRLFSQCADFVGEICDTKYGKRPELQVNDLRHLTFAYLPVHLEYVFTELLKNAFRATVEEHGRTGSIPNIEVTISASSNKPQNVAIRIRDRGGGIDPADLSKIWEYSFTTVSNEPEDDGLDFMSNTGVQTSSLAGLGYGLPLSKAYTEYFGGHIAVESCFGWGTDVYLEFNGLDKAVVRGMA